MEEKKLINLIEKTINETVANKKQITKYRDPLIAYVSANDPEFSNLSDLINFPHLMPNDLLDGAKSVVCFYLPFEPGVVYSNQKDNKLVSRDWGVAYYETNKFLGEISSELIEILSQHGIRAAAEPSTGNFDEDILISNWSHKSVAVISGLGSFGLHQMVITDLGCTGRFGSIVIDADITIQKSKSKNRCEYFEMGTCMDCVLICPANALSENVPFNRFVCWELLQENAKYFLDLGDDIQVCGKCATTGPCALKSAI